MLHPRRALLLAALLPVAAVVTACAGSSGSSTHSGHDTMTMPSHSSNSMSGADGMSGMPHTEDTGTTASSGGYKLKLATPTAPLRKPATLSFTVTGPNGKPVSHYVVDQTKKLHLYVIRTDLAGYQHLHPSLAADGGWSTPITFRQPGDYHVVADFTTATGGVRTTHILGAPLRVAGDWTKTPLPAPAGDVNVDGYTVTVAGTLNAATDSPMMVRILQDGQAVTNLQPYLGVWAHLSTFRENTLAFTHLHPRQQPMTGMTMDSPSALTFTADLPHAGRYRVFVQFQTDGIVHTAALTVRAT